MPQPSLIAPVKRNILGSSFFGRRGSKPARGQIRCRTGNAKIYPAAWADRLVVDKGCSNSSSHRLRFEVVLKEASEGCRLDDDSAQQTSHSQ